MRTCKSRMLAHLPPREAHIGAGNLAADGGLSDQGVDVAEEASGLGGQLIQAAPEDFVG